MRYLLPFTLLLLPILSQAAISNEELQQVATELNKKVPMMVDAETRLDKLSAGNKRLIYFYTMINYATDKLDKKKFTSIQRDAIVKNGCKPLAPFLMNKINIS